MSGLGRPARWCLSLGVLDGVVFLLAPGHLLVQALCLVTPSLTAVFLLVGNLVQFGARFQPMTRPLLVGAVCYAAFAFAFAITFADRWPAAENY